MKKLYKAALIRVYSRWLPRERDRLGLTQEQMAETLSISTYGYIKQEHGKNACSGLTLARFYAYCCSDPQQFRDELKEAFEKAEEDEYAAV